MATCKHCKHCKHDGHVSSESYIVKCKNGLSSAYVHPQIMTFLGVWHDQEGVLSFVLRTWFWFLLFPTIGLFVRRYFLVFFCFDSEDTSLVFSTPDQTNWHLVQQTNWDKRMSSELSIISGLHYFLLNGINEHFLFWFVKGAMVLTMSFGDFHCLCLGKYDGYCSRGAKIFAREPQALERIFSTSWTISYT